jgi:hypothetical protein
MLQRMLVRQKTYIGMGWASVEMSGEAAWLTLAINIGIERAVAAFYTSKIEEFATNNRL